MTLGCAWCGHTVVPEALAIHMLTGQWVRVPGSLPSVPVLVHLGGLSLPGLAHTQRVLWAPFSGVRSSCGPGVECGLSVGSLVAGPWVSSSPPWPRPASQGVQTPGPAHLLPFQPSSQAADPLGCGGPGLGLGIPCRQWAHSQSPFSTRWGPAWRGRGRGWLQAARAGGLPGGGAVLGSVGSEAGAGFQQVTGVPGGGPPPPWLSLIRWPLHRRFLVFQRPNSLFQAWASKLLPGVRSEVTNCPF